MDITIGLDPIVAAAFFAAVCFVTTFIRKGR